MSTIDFYFDFSSPYGFVAAMQIDAVAARTGRAVRWRPFLLGAIYRKVGQSPLEHPLKPGYVTEIDVPRLGRRLGLAIRVPADFPAHSLPAARAFYWIEATAPEKAPDFARAAYRRYWLDGKGTSDEEVALDVAVALGFDRDRVVQGLRDPSPKARLVDESEQAIARGVFGSPFLIVDDEPFWGSDRLDYIGAPEGTKPFHRPIS